MNYRIAVLGGDGIGPEVVAEAVKVLRVVGERFGHTFEFKEALIGACAIDATNGATALPQETIDVCKASDAILLGAVGHIRFDNDPNAKVRPEQGLLGIRKAMGLFANIRPVRVSPTMIDASPLRPERLEGTDMIFVRELTGGIYFGEKKRDRNDQGEWASDLCIYSQVEIERVVRVAAQMARGRRKKLMLVDKANVLETSRLWRSVTKTLMQAEFPDVQLDMMFVDACAMDLLRRPTMFDVVVTENMFGDILTDEAAVLSGSMGMLPSASLGSESSDRSIRMGLYEPIHGAAHDIIGQGKANPLATILSSALMMRHSFGLEREAQAIEAAVDRVIDQGNVTVDIARPGQTPITTTQVGDAVAQAIAAA